MSPSDLGGLVIVIGFAFIALRGFFPPEFENYFVILFICTEIFAIVRWLYVERKGSSQTMSLFPDETEDEPEPRFMGLRISSGLLPIVVQLVLALGVLVVIVAVIGVTDYLEWNHRDVSTAILAIAAVATIVIFLVRRARGHDDDPLL